MISDGPVICCFLKTRYELVYCISPAANAVQKSMVPFFGQVMEHLKIYLSNDMSEEEMPLQVQALGEFVSALAFVSSA